MKKSYQNGVPANTRIKHHLLKLVLRAGERPTLLPSSKELAKEFGTARSTVLAAIRELEEKHFITGKRGIGIFSNPSNMIRRQKMIGITIGKGDNFYFTKSNWDALSVLGTALGNAKFNVRLPSINVMEENAKVRRELNDQALNALLMLHTDPRIPPEIQTSLPTIMIGSQLSAKTPDIRFSYVKALAELHEKIHFSHPVFPGGMKWMLDNYFLPFWGTRPLPAASPDLFLKSEFSCWEERLEVMLRKEKPDVIFCTEFDAENFSLFLRKRKIRIPLVSWRQLPAEADFRGYCFEEPWKDASRMVLLMLKNLFSKGKICPEHAVLEVKLKKKS